MIPISSSCRPKVKAPKLSVSRRIRRTPFSEGVEAAGVKAYTSYNKMLLPTLFRSLNADYRHLKSAVQVWDVSCERQVELRGPDAARLVQLVTPRDLRKAKIGRCLYVPMIDAAGGLINDPVAVKLDDDRWWLSISDSDVLYWIKGLAYGMGLDVAVFEPDVSPLAVQGPKADALMARVFGAAVQDLSFFGFDWFQFQGTPHVIARSGYSKQGGFEIYVEGGQHGMPIWNALFEAGADLDVRAGGPNMIERIEGGLLSYGNDMTLENTPVECGLQKFCSPDPTLEYIGRNALEERCADGPQRMLSPIEIATDALPPCDRPWALIGDDGRWAGQICSAALSPDFGGGVAIGMVERDHWAPGTMLNVQTQDGLRRAQVRAEFWI